MKISMRRISAKYQMTLQRFFCMIFSVHEQERSIRSKRFIIIYTELADIPMYIHIVFIIPKNGILKLNEIRQKAYNIFHIQKPLWILARIVLLDVMPKVRIISVRKNITIANEKRYTAVGPVNVGQLGPPRSSSSHVNEEQINSSWSCVMFNC